MTTPDPITEQIHKEEFAEFNKNSSYESAKAEITGILSERRQEIREEIETFSNALETRWKNPVSD